MTAFASAAELTRLAAAILVAAGASERNARRVADHLVEAESVGRASHGLRLIDWYVERLLTGSVSGVATPSMAADSGGPLLKVSGNKAFGQIVGDYAAQKGVSRARKIGVSVVTIEGAGHFGRNARWPEYAARRGVASVHFIHGFGSVPLMAPFGASEPKLRTSPIALGAPSPDGHPVVMDFSVAEFSANTIKLAAERGERLASPAIVLPDATRSDQPADFLTGGGALLPFGGFKGYGLAVFAEIFAGVLAAGGTGEAGENVMLSIYIDVRQVTDLPSYFERLAAKLNDIRSARPLQEGTPVPIPGDRSRETRRKTRRIGIALTPALKTSLRHGAARAHLDPAALSPWELLLAAH
jgi:uncharacterized oxidoreductase